ncbi:MAG: low temperature requirement protein A [Candidatus Doudnabacteria bacterium]
MSAQPVEREQRVSPLELFFDLVFVFAFTQVTTLLSSNPTWSGLEHALLLLTALWWAWAAYAWLTNTVDPGESLVWGTMLVAGGAMFVGALALPEAFGSHGVVFGVAFLIVALMQLALYALAARGDPDLLQAILRITPSSIAGATLIAVAGFVHGGLKPVLWLIALALGFFAPLVARPSGWRLHPAHFIERHGSIVIIAIGESLVAVGLGVRHGGLGAEEIGAAVLGFVVAAAFWLAYFDFFTIRAQQLLDDRSGVQQIALARDTYTYLHLPMVVGIVLFAFAVKTTLGDVHAELSIVPAVALCGGPALYLLAFVGIRFRIGRTVRGGRLVAAVVCAALVAVALAVQAIVALALVAAVWVVLHAYELIWWRAARAELRAQREPASAS